MASDRRLVSLDAFRGLTMFLLVAESARVYHSLGDIATGIPAAIVTQFTHHPWNGLRFWDLIQPYFMFIVGVAMPFSFARRIAQGEPWSNRFRHVLRRSLVLLLLGVGLHIGYSGKLVLELWNVLSQLSVTYLVAFLWMEKSARAQIGFTALLLIGMELLYRLWAVPGFDQPFVKDHNFGSYMDLVLMGKINAGGGWVAINCIPTAAHTMWGVLAGALLKGERSPSHKIKVLAWSGIAMIAAGYALDPVTPIIKRICTSSFVIVSGGYCLLTLALFYWLVDVRKWQRWSFFAVVVGMNSIFIYLFAETIGPRWLNGFTAAVVGGFFGFLGEGASHVLTAFVVLGIEWWLCLWLYRKRLFFKI